MEVCNLALVCIPRMHKQSSTTAHVVFFYFAVRGTKKERTNQGRTPSLHAIWMDVVLLVCDIPISHFGVRSEWKSLRNHRPFGETGSCFVLTSPPCPAKERTFSRLGMKFWMRHCRKLWRAHKKSTLLYVRYVWVSSGGGIQQEYLETGAIQSAQTCRGWSHKGDQFAGPCCRIGVFTFSKEHKDKRRFHRQTGRQG